MHICYRHNKCVTVVGWGRMCVKIQNDWLCELVSSYWIFLVVLIRGILRLWVVADVPITNT